MTETFNVNTNKHEMLFTTVILICNKMKSRNLDKKLSKTYKITKFRPKNKHKGLREEKKKTYS